MNFNSFENEIIEYWKEENIIQKVKQLRINCPIWEYIDVLTFINDKPMYYHLLVSAIKDIMARYMSQKGYQITNQIGFDCHCLSLEQEAEKVVGKVYPNDDLEKLKIFNNECRNIIYNCSEEWYNSLGHFDKEQNYKTSDLKYMESLWWAFKKLWDDGLIYQSKKVMPYSPKCESLLSNVEAISNYHERTDISVYVKFKLYESDECLLIWTTSPWSLFANQGICINKNLEYQLVKLSNEKIWIAKECVQKLFKDQNYKILSNIKGSTFIGLRYEPIFPINDFNNYRIYSDSRVQAITGTGLVHLAPLFGEDDMRIMEIKKFPDYLVNSQVKFNISYIVNNVNIKDKFVMDTSSDIVIHLKNTNQAFKSEIIKHNYPYCWRTNFPLINIATDAWFINVQKIIPDKFTKDWCISKNKVWGTPIPIWMNDNGDKICIGSVKELEELTGKLFTDIHLDSLNLIEFTNNRGTFKRTFGVLDNYFESGMAGLSRFGYPECKTKSFPINFIAEYSDENVYWFYILNILSTALNYSPSFKNVKLNKLIINEDNTKISNPNIIIKKYGADIFRLYMIGEKDLVNIRTKIISYYDTHLLLNDCLFDHSRLILSNNQLDKWIKMKLIQTCQCVYKHVENFELSSIPSHIYQFIDILCNIFIKLSINRLKGRISVFTHDESTSTLYFILKDFNILLAPLIPHLSEYFYKSLPHENLLSVHFETINIKSILDYKLDNNLLDGFYSVNELFDAVYKLRKQINKPKYYTLDKLVLYTELSNISIYQNFICKELNIKNLIIKSADLLGKIYRPNKELLYKIFNKEANKYINMIERGDICWIGCSSNYYTYDYNLYPIENMIGCKFNYTNTKGDISQSLLYLMY